MRIYQFWKRDEPSCEGGESITVKITFESYDQSEIDEDEPLNILRKESR